MLNALKSSSNIQVLILFRFVAVILQLLVILAAEYVLSYELEIRSMLLVITFELVVNIAWFIYYKKAVQDSSIALLIQTLFDVIVLTALLYLSGGATNAFVSILLVPVAFAAVCLPPLLMLAALVAAIACYTLLLYLIPEHAMHHVDMAQHFTGMWVNFLLSALVVAIVVAALAARVSQKERAIAKFREEQLKQEKLLVLGIASAQVTHQLATPIAAIQLLADELAEYYPEQSAIDDLQQQLGRCSDSLARFRQLAFDVKAQKTQLQSCASVAGELLDQINLNFPDIEVIKSNFGLGSQSDNIVSDSALLPALLNLVQNAIRASKARNRQAIELSSEVTKTQWLLTIRDFGEGFSSKLLDKLGSQPVASEQGLGLAVYLSHATFERLSINLRLCNDPTQGAIAQLIVPLAQSETG